MLVEAGLSRLRGAMADASLNAKERSQLISGLVESLAVSPPLQQAQIEELSINGTLLQAATAEDPTDLPLLALPLERSLDALAKLAQELEPKLRSSLLAQVQEFRGFVSGPDSIVETRRRELDLIAEGRRLLAQNAEVSSRLTNVVSRMVGEAEKDISRANIEALGGLSHRYIRSVPPCFWASAGPAANRTKAAEATATVHERCGMVVPLRCRVFGLAPLAPAPARACSAAA